MDKESVQATSPKAYDQVLEYLKTLIKNKDISYGGKIPSERELMETLRISRNSVREALRILEHTGVLESRHGKGNFLVNRMGESLSSVFSMLVLMEESNYREVNQLRSVLEKQAYVQACALISGEGKEKAGAIINRMENGDLEERMRSDHELHHLVFGDINIVQTGKHIDIFILTDRFGYQKIFYLLRNRLGDKDVLIFGKLTLYKFLYRVVVLRVDLGVP